MFATSVSCIMSGLYLMASGLLLFLVPCATTRSLMRPVRDATDEKTPCELYTDMYTITVRLALDVNNTHSVLTETYGGTASVAGSFGHGFTLDSLDTVLRMPYRNWTKPGFLSECRQSSGNGTCPPPLNITVEEKVSRLRADLKTFRTYLQEVRDDEASHTEEEGSDTELLEVLTRTTDRLESLLTNIRITAEAMGFAILDDVPAVVMTSTEQDPTGELLRRSRDQQVIWEFLWYLRWAVSDITWLKHRHCQQ
ncbi:Hypp1919 [Branchiostoma lanceolatum]|uniref:Hypp1919 protein n=1 Tax=Branchiostoma lanceolatum TaxID=7740 RepID=A0A8J9ZM20_BRALA|nr:Hypp1919 [Branchiostoma lanceolatum]